ncbi:MAG: hypothetical protein C4529_09680 [Deltaproteobacteria bacterium]|nr:MAG: hypothetical protein C4529_09680 [Deltaproteobacteria bacterium]
MDIRNRKGRLLAAIALLFSIAFTSCGGGGDFAGGGTGGTGVGPVTGFGSVKVNGVRYTTTGANILIGGVENRPESELKVGMRVRVDGDFSAVDNTGTAGRIEVIREVRGPLDDNGVDNVLNRLRVAGQTVLVDPATVFDNVAGLTALQSLQAGTLRHPEVEVHGAADDVGFIHATYVRKGADDFPVASDDVEVRGKVSGLDPFAFRFLIGSLPVSYSGAGLVKVNWPLTGIANGAYVEAKGRITAAGGSGTLSASRIEVLDNAVGGNNDPVRVEGYVVSGASKDSFVLLGPGGRVTVNGVGATLSGGTVAPGVKVQVEGAVSGAILRASVVRVRPAGKVRIEAGVSGAPNVAAGTFTVLGKQIRTDGYTRFKDTSGGLRTFGLADLPSGDNVMVVGSYDASDDVVNAILVERIPSLDNDRPLLQGPAAGEIPDVSFTIVGIRVDAGFTNTEYFAKDGTSLGSGPTAVAAFFTELVDGDVVMVKRGVFSPGTPSTIDEGVGTPRMEIGFEQVND